MILERVQQFADILHDLTSGEPKRLTFFRIGGVSRSSRIEYEVIGHMVADSPHLGEIHTHILRYLKGALDVEVSISRPVDRTGIVRVDLINQIWHALHRLQEEDAEQLFFDGPDFGIVRAEKPSWRINKRSWGSMPGELMDYFTAAPKPTQSYLVDQPGANAEHYYRTLLSLLVLGFLHCVSSDEEGGNEVTPLANESRDTSEDASPDSASKDQIDPIELLGLDDYEATGTDGSNGTGLPRNPADAPIQENQYVSEQDATEISLTRRKRNPAFFGTEAALGHKPKRNGTVAADEPCSEGIVEQNDENTNSLLDAPIVESDDDLSPQERAKAKQRKVAGLKKLLQAAKNGFD
ncbi:MAG: hypothetical protein CL946_01495 [Ectothiorhodospiraceae bacterium]|nr:hypothetical protein [Ectothiorhodospiraceae bacterium]